VNFHWFLWKCWWPKIRMPIACGSKFCLNGMSIVAARGFLAPGGIDYFEAASPVPSPPSSPLRSGALKIGPIKPSQGIWRSAVSSPVGSGESPTILMHFEDLEMLRVTFIMCIVQRTWFVLPCPSLPQQSLQNFCIFRVAKSTAPPICAPSAGARVSVPCPLRAATACLPIKS